MKKCPACSSDLGLVRLEENLLASKCTGCEGIWISSASYFEWINRPNQELKELEIDDTIPLPVLEDKKAILCPDCGRFLRKFKIWPNRDFYLDKCGGCNGIWFDNKEWEVFKELGIENQVHLFFSEPWQKKLRTEEVRIRFEAMYLEKFGAENYAKIQEVREWIINEPYKSELIAFLGDHDPYKG